MKTACFIPIKANSVSVPGKNFRVVNGKKLYEYICEHVKAANVFDDVYIDTNSQEISEYAVLQIKVNRICRKNRKKILGR